jgi:hypothetical protein
MACNRVNFTFYFDIFITVCHDISFLLKYQLIGDYNAEENQGNGNEISAPDDGIGTPKRVEQFKFV